MKIFTDISCIAAVVFFIIMIILLMYKIWQGKEKKTLDLKLPDGEKTTNGEPVIKEEKKISEEKAPKFTKYTDKGYIGQEKDDKKSIFRWR